MKKLLACLMACVLLWSASACAQSPEAFEMTLTLQADEAQLAPVIERVFGTDEESIVSGFAQVLNGSSVSFVAQRDAGQARLNLMGEEIIDILVINTQDGSQLALYNLLPGYALKVPLDGTVGYLDLNMLENLDLTKMTGQLAWKLDAFVQSLDSKTETGSFVGDAYQGGVRRDTLWLDDRDLSLLLDCILTAAEGDSQVEALVQQAGYDMTQLVQGIRNFLQEAALMNTYRYQASAVYDEADELIGLSLTAMEGDKQVATLSVGLSDTYVEAVWGYGYQGVNYYISFFGTLEDQADGAVRFNYLVDVLADTTGLGYTLTSSLEEALLERHALSFTQSENEGVFLTEGTLEMNFYDEEPLCVTVTLSNAIMENGAENTTHALFWQDSTDPVLVLSAASVPCEPLNTEVGSVKVIELDNLDDAASDEELATLIYQAGTELGMKLFGLLPPGLLYLLMQ